MLLALLFYTLSLCTVSLHTCHHILTSFLTRYVKTSQHTSNCVVLCTVCQGVSEKGKFSEFFRIKSILNKTSRSMCQMKGQIKWCNYKPIQHKFVVNLQDKNIHWCSQNSQLPKIAKNLTPPKVDLTGVSCLKTIMKMINSLQMVTPTGVQICYIPITSSALYHWAIQQLVLWL